MCDHCVTKHTVVYNFTCISTLSARWFISSSCDHQKFFFSMSSNIIVEHVLMKICKVRVTSTSKSHNVQAPL